jgi:hypothetical protein
MQSDQAPQIEGVPGPKWELPEIKDVKIRSRQFKPRRPRNFDHPMAAVKDSVEIVVSLASPVPIRAMSPVLWVGGKQLTESEAADKSGKKLRFWSLDPAKLEPGAPISISWMNEQPAITDQKAKFTYKRPK